MTGLVRDPGVFERFTEAIHSGLKVPSTHLLPDSRSSDDLVKGPTALLSQSDITTLLAVYSNLSSLLRKASANGVRIAFDAEQSWYQPALSRIVSLLAKEFNSVAEDGGRDGTARAPIVYNTYQANLKETESVIRADLQSAREEGEKMQFGDYDIALAALSLVEQQDTPSDSSWSEARMSLQRMHEPRKVVKLRKYGPTRQLQMHVSMLVPSLFYKRSSTPCKRLLHRPTGISI